MNLTAQAASFEPAAPFPPSLAAYPLLGMVVVMSFWVVALVCLHWIYKIVETGRSFPAPPTSYIAVARRFRLLLLSSIFIVMVPRLAQLMAWQLLSAEAKAALSITSWLAVVPCAGLTVMAWWADEQMRRTEAVAVEDHGFFSVVPAQHGEKTRGMVALLLIFVVALATTYVRPKTDEHRAHTYAVERH